LVPAGISGTDRLSRLGPLRVVFGAPVGVADLAGRPLPEAAQVATDRLRDAIVRLEREAVG
jgi:hypothetical protein